MTIVYRILFIQRWIEALTKSTDRLRKRVERIESRINADFAALEKLCEEIMVSDDVLKELKRLREEAFRVEGAQEAVREAIQQLGGAPDRSDGGDLASVG